jgi:hypothetical protein
MSRYGVLIASEPISTGSAPVLRSSYVSVHCSPNRRPTRSSSSFSWYSTSIPVCRQRTNTG